MPAGRESYGSSNSKEYTQEGLVPFVVDAVYAMAHALENMRRDKCPHRARGMCSGLRSVSGEDLLTYIRNVTFKGKHVLNNC